jgi:hypothetical protein
MPSEDLKYLGETLFGITLPEDPQEAREKFSHLFRKTLAFTVRGRDLIQFLETYDPKVTLVGEFYSTSKITFRGKAYNVATPRAYPRLMALPMKASFQEIEEILISCEPLEVL